tara:strand:- start:103 stop:240 length:138 start_codon:yes stop_codon:yes gene_type:complete
MVPIETKQLINSKFNKERIENIFLRSESLISGRKWFKGSRDRGIH